MATLSELSPRPVPVVEPSTSLDEVIRLMEEEPLGTVALVGDEQYMGIFNADALQSNLIPPGADLSTLQVGPYVHPVRVIGTPQTPADDALALMTRRGVDIIPVVRNRTFLGVVTRADVEKLAGS